MVLGDIDLDPRFEYIIIYRNKKYNTLNTWSLPVGSFELNYKMMQENPDEEIVGVYKKIEV